jgi:hypothetical protein
MRRQWHNFFMVGEIILVLLVLWLVFGKACQSDDEQDLRIPLTLAIAHEYGLTRDQAILLLAIEKHEAGGPGKEFGIEAIPCEWKDGRKSFLINCARACETIKNRCPDPTLKSIIRLGRRWAKDKMWYLYVWRNMQKFKNILY